MRVHLTKLQLQKPNNKDVLHQEKRAFMVLLICFLYK